MWVPRVVAAGPTSCLWVQSSGRAQPMYGPAYTTRCHSCLPIVAVTCTASSCLSLGWHRCHQTVYVEEEGMCVCGCLSPSKVRNQTVLGWHYPCLSQQPQAGSLAVWNTTHLQGETKHFLREPRHPEAPDCQGSLGPGPTSPCINPSIVARHCKNPSQHPRFTYFVCSLSRLFHYAPHMTNCLSAFFRCLTRCSMLKGAIDHDTAKGGPVNQTGDTSIQDVYCAIDKLAVQ